jgi:hypothetical protein
MEETQKEFEQEIKTAIKYVLEIEQHSEDMDPDDVKDICNKIKLPLTRILRDIQDGKIKSDRW